MKNLSLFSLFVLLPALLFAQLQKRPLTHDDILKWNRITEKHVSNNGKYVVYKQEPWEGDPVLKITTPGGDQIASVPCASGAKITADSEFLVYTLKPPVDTVRALKLKKTKKEEMPQDKLVLFRLTTGETETIDKIKSVKIPEEWSGWLAWQAEEPKDTTKKETGKGRSKGETDQNSFPLTIKNLGTGESTVIPAVSDYVFAEEKELLVVVSEGKDSTFEAGVYVVDLPNNVNTQIFKGKKIKQLVVNTAGEKIAFLAAISEEKKNEPNYTLWKRTQKSTQRYHHFRRRNSGA